MKKQILHIILAGLLALLPSLALAQSNELAEHLPLEQGLSSPE